MANKIYSKTFIKTSESSFINEDENGKPILINTRHTLRLTQRKDKYILYELDRKKKPRRIQTLKIKKEDTLNKKIAEIRDEKYFIKEKYYTPIGKGGTKLVQSNYLVRGRNRIQMIGYVKVKDTVRHITDYFTGISKKTFNVDINERNIREMEEQVINMAIAKFIDYHGFTNYADLEAVIIKRRFMYFKNTYEKRFMRKQINIAKKTIQ